MTNQRVQRVSEQIKKEISGIIKEELKDPRVGFITIISVEVTNDLKIARVYFSVYGDEEQKKDTLEGLQKATGFVRREIGKRIKLRHTPEIEFIIDSSIEHGARISKLLEEVRNNSS